MERETRIRPGWRRSIPVIVLVLFALYMGWVWLLAEYGQQQGRVLATLTSVAISVIALLVWALCFAPLGRRARLGLLAAVLGIGAGAWGLLEVRGVSGNFVPILGLRFFSGGGAAEAPEIAALPDSFDSEAHWPQCAKVIGDIRDQSNCGCCWAFAAAEAASDRLCIASNASVALPLSAAAMAVAAAIAVAAGFQTFSVGLRWWISDRWPNTNMFEAVTTASWFGVACAVLLELAWLRRTSFRGLLPLGSAATAASGPILAIPGLARIWVWVRYSR